ncbi:hypothetical protein E4U58_002081 [Claviceps cyperi]|nr:hypothetical protein E4U58_002081 [Claviceps cyperi]
MSDMFSSQLLLDPSNDGFQFDASTSESPNLLLPHDELGQGGDSDYGTVPSSTAIGSAGTAQKKGGRVKHRHLPSSSK